MRRNKLVRTVAVIFVTIVALHQISCSKTDQQGRIDFYINLDNGSVTSSDGSYQTQLSDYQNLTITGIPVYVNGLIVFKGTYPDPTYQTYYYALSQNCTSDNCVLEYQVAYNRLHCPCDESLFDTDGNPTFGAATIPLYKYAVILANNQLHIYSP